MFDMKKFSSMSAILLLCTCIVARADARSEYIVVQKEFRTSDSVLLVEIDTHERLSEDRSECGTRYTARIHQRFKGAQGLDGEYITFGRAEGLVRGARYLLFLSYVADPLVTYEALRKQHDLPQEDPEQKKLTIRQIECRGTVPGFIFDSRTAWEVKLSYVIIEGHRPAVPDTVRLSRAGILRWLLNKEDLFSYLRSLALRPD